mgnify:CR=1 FL=1
MKLSSEDKKNLSTVRFDKAEEFLDDARANLQESRSKTAVNRSYYAVLNAVRSLLILEGVNPETHSGALTTLCLRFIKPGLLPTQVVKDMKLLLSRRADVDYGDFESIDIEEAEDSVKKAEKLLEQIDTVRRKLIAEL